MSTHLVPSDHGAGEGSTNEGGTSEGGTSSVDDADVSVLFRLHQPHAAYSRGNPSGDIL